MNVLRRAWRVYADPAGSETARLLRFIIPIEAVFAVLRLTLDWSFPMPSTRPMDVIWLYALLWVVRQRDEARAERAELREDAPEVLGRARPDRPTGW
ncbi:MAG: hypothetical protein ABR585_07590 [Gemmatimonadaceae bacterium]